jgi:dephospho-CoA kinase
MSTPRGNRSARVPRIALTGGIASGKSTVAQLFAALGARLIDTDRISREVVAAPSAVLDRIVQRFGPGILLKDGSLDRAQLRNIVFTDADARRDLEAIVHPAIREEVERQCAELNGPYQLVAIPLLVETNTQQLYDRVLLVDASPETQKRRLMQRDGVGPDAAERMLAAQASREARRAVAHDIIDNDGDIKNLATQVEQLHQRYLALGSRSRDT